MLRKNHPHKDQDHPAGGAPDAGNAALAQQVERRLGRRYPAHPVHRLVGRDVDHPVGVARRDVAHAQQGDQQAGGVDGVAAQGLQRQVRTLDGAVTGHEADVVVHPGVDGDGVMAELRRLGAERVRQPRVRRLRQGRQWTLVQIDHRGLGVRERSSCTCNSIYKPEITEIKKYPIQLVTKEDFFQDPYTETAKKLAKEIILSSIK